MFIKLAKKLSMDYEIDIDIDIFEHPYFVSVELHMGCSYYSGRGIDMLAKLLEESDSMSFFRSKTEPTDFTISMDCFIYDRYVGGKKLPGQG